MAISKIKVGNTEHELQTTIANINNLQAALDNKVPISRTINGKELSSNITISTSDVGAYSKTEIDSMEFITIEDIDAICGQSITVVTGAVLDDAILDAAILL